MVLFCEFHENTPKYCFKAAILKIIWYNFKKRTPSVQRHACFLLKHIQNNKLKTIRHRFMVIIGFLTIFTKDLLLLSCRRGGGGGSGCKREKLGTLFTKTKIDGFSWILNTTKVFIHEYWVLSFETHHILMVNK